MANLTVSNEKFVTFSVTSDEDVVWRAFFISGGAETPTNIIESFTFDDSAIFATYADGEEVIWGTLHTASSETIHCTVANDINRFGVVATNSANVTAHIIFDPYSLQQTIIPDSQTTNSVSISAYFVQAFTGNIVPAEDGKATWTVGAFGNNLQGRFEGDADYIDLIANPGLEKIIPPSDPDQPNVVEIVYNGTDPDMQILVTAAFAPTPDPATNNEFTTFNVPNTIVVFNPGIVLNAIMTDTSSVNIEGRRGGDPLPNTVVSTWDINYSDGIDAFVGTDLDQPYTFGTAMPDNASIRLVASDASKIYIYSLTTDIGGVAPVSGIFRPFLEYGSLSQMSAEVVTLPPEANMVNYSFRALGQTNKIIHNLPPGKPIQWTCDNTDIAFANLPNGSSYSFGNIGLVSDIEKIDVRIFPSVVTTSPRICSIGFNVNSMDGTEVDNTYRFEVFFNEVVDTEWLSAGFNFQCEPTDQLIFYRSVAPESTRYTLTNTSRLPANSNGVFIYDINGEQIEQPFDLRVSDVLPTFEFEFDRSVEKDYAIQLIVNVFTEGRPLPVQAYSRIKHLKIVDIPDASDYKVYPEYTWSEAVTAWVPLVPSNDSEIPAGIYGFCHTENFIFESNTIGSNIKSRRFTIIDKDTGHIYGSTTVSDVNTGTVSVTTPSTNAEIITEVALFTDNLPEDMPARFYDTCEGELYSNIARGRTFEIYGPESFGANIRIGTSNDIIPVPNSFTLTGEYDRLTTSSPFEIFVRSFNFILTSEFWSDTISVPVRNNSITTNVMLNADNTGGSFLSVPRNEITPITIRPTLNYNLRLRAAHPNPATAWCLANAVYDGSTARVDVVAYPQEVLVFNPNRYVLTDANISVENLVQCLPTPLFTNEFVWNYGFSDVPKSDCEPLVINIADPGTYSIDLSNAFTYNGTNQSFDRSVQNVVNVLSEYAAYNPKLTRVYTETKLELPYDIKACRMPPNEWVTADTFNAAMNKLAANLSYLNDMSSLYDVPPTLYTGWYGTIKYGGDAIRSRWFDNTTYNSFNFDRPDKATDTVYSNLQSVAVRDNIMFISTGRELHVLDRNFMATPIIKRPYKSLGDPFVNIKSIDIDDSGRVYVLDSYDTNNLLQGSKNRVVVYEFNESNRTLNLLYEWGGLGGQIAKTKFNSPSDLFIDAVNNIWVADTENLCIKRYTRSGSWLATITSDYFTESEKPLSVVVDGNGSIFILANSYIVELDPEYNFIRTIDIELGTRKIRNCQDGGFIYVVYGDKVVKLMTNGSAAGIIANDGFINYSRDYRDVFHDEYRNLYVVNRTHILKYVDLLQVVTIKADTENKMWNADDISVNKDEYIQDWVINRCFQRFWDNLEIYRRSLRGKFTYQKISTITTDTILETLEPSEDFDYCKYDWLYTRGKWVDYEYIFDVYKPTIRSFTMDEYKVLPISKADCYVGINELQTADVYNRVFNALFECEKVLLEMIND